MDGRVGGWTDRWMDRLMDEMYWHVTSKKHVTELKMLRMCKEGRVHGWMVLCVGCQFLITISLCLCPRHHHDCVTGLAFTSDGSHLLSSGADSLLVLYDSSQQSFPVIRALANTVARMKELSPCAIALNRRGTRAAFVGPSEFAVTVVDAHTLDEVSHGLCCCVWTDLSCLLLAASSWHQQCSLWLGEWPCVSRHRHSSLLLSWRHWSVASGNQKL